MYEIIVISGNVGIEPEIKATNCGLNVAQFTVAVSRKYSNAGSYITETTWFKIVAWDKLSAFVEKHIKKGSKVIVEGRLACDPATGNPKAWIGKDGKAGANFEIVASKVRCLANWKDTNDKAESSFDDEDIPF